MAVEQRFLPAPLSKGGAEPPKALLVEGGAEPPEAPLVKGGWGDQTKRPAIFLDKDGTLIVDVPYNVDPQRMQLQPGAAAGVQSLHQAGFALVVISNQSGVARGYFAEAALGAVERRLKELLGVPLAGFYYCPHHPEGVVAEYAIACSCRKPAPGLLLQAAADLHLDLSQSWMIGDILNDVEAAHRAGCRAVLIDNGNETEWLEGEGRVPDQVATDVGEAAELILGEGVGALERWNVGTLGRWNVGTLGRWKVEALGRWGGGLVAIWW